MNFFKKISPKFVAFLIFVYLSFILTGCPPVVLTKTDEALAEFQDTYNTTFRELVEKQDALNQEYNENVHKLNAIEDDFKDLEPTMDLFLFKRKILKLSQNALDILEEMQEMLEKRRDNINDQSRLISKLQGNVVKITDPSKKLLAQEIADKLRKLNNLLDELTELHEKETEYLYSYWEDVKAVSLDKMTLERAVKYKEERDEKIKENNKEIEELHKAVRALATEIADLKAKLDSLGP